MKNSIIDNYLRSGKESETLLINQLSILRSESNQEVFKFGFGQSPFPVPEKITESLAKAAHRKEYMSVQGHLPLREAIANFHNKVENKNWNAENIIIGSGSKILIFSIMATFEQAEVILPSPSWVSYEPQAKLLGHKVDWIETSFEDKWKLTPGSLERYCANRKDPNTPLILVLNYPNNPTGQSFDESELKALALVMKNYKIIVIADEIYSLLIFNGSQPSISDYYPQGCIVTSGLSKWCGAGGWRLGFCYIPPQLGDQLFQGIIGIASETYSCAAAPIQIAATTAYEEIGLANEFIQKQIKLLSYANDYCCKHLKSVGVKVHSCVGGFYIFPDFSDLREKLKNKRITNSTQLTKIIMEETGVALLPGNAFGMSGNSLTTRLAFVDFDGSQILNDSKKQADIETVKTGIDRIINWLKKL